MLLPDSLDFPLRLWTKFFPPTPRIEGHRGNVSKTLVVWWTEKMTQLWIEELNSGLAVYVTFAEKRRGMKVSSRSRFWDRSMLIDLNWRKAHPLVNGFSPDLPLWCLIWAEIIPFLLTGVPVFLWWYHPHWFLGFLCGSRWACEAWFNALPSKLNHCWLDVHTGDWSPWVPKHTPRVSKLPS